MKRRDFLHAGLAALGAGATQAMLRPATGWAQASGSRRFVSIQLPGAPPRWLYDCFVTAYGSENFNLAGNQSIATHYGSANGRYVRPEFATVSMKGINVPPYWQQQVPAAGGSLRPVNALLDNLLSLQGVSTAVDGHETCQRLHWQPVAGAQSRSALAADPNDSPLPAVTSQVVTYTFQSARAKSFVPIPDLEENPLARLLQPFLTQLPTGSPAIAAAEAALDSDAQAWSRTASETRSSQSNALTLFARGFGNLDAAFAQRRAVYRDLIDRSLSNNLVLPGFTDLPVGGTGGRGVQYGVGLGEGVETPDLRDMFGPGVDIPGLADQFVVIEFLLKEDLSRSVAIGTTPLTGMAGVDNPYEEQQFDEHEVGVMPSLITNAKFYTALSSCLLELIDQLKEAGIFDDTIIEVAGEFSRSPLPEGEGSDHGWSGKVSSFYGGRIRGPHVIGNIYSTPPPDSGFDAYPGTWGYGAPVDGVQSILSLNHEIATLAAMLGVPSPTNAAPSLVSVDGSGRIVPAPGIEPARIVPT